MEADVLLENNAQDQIPFSVAQKVVGAIIEQYGKFQNTDCRDMARTLNSKERHGTGRMTLKNFYGSGWQFSETKDFLNQLGTLDKKFRPEEGPWVVIPNYVVSLTNCLASSSMYTVCCMDPCEDILRHLESRVGAPEATPEELVHLVAATASATVQAPRGLSAGLVRHLNEIAENHGGKVPLHGRLFAKSLPCNGTLPPWFSAISLRCRTRPAESPRGACTVAEAVAATRCTSSSGVASGASTLDSRCRRMSSHGSMQHTVYMLEEARQLVRDTT